MFFDIIFILMGKKNDFLRNNIYNIFIVVGILHKIFYKKIKINKYWNIINILYK